MLPLVRQASTGLGARVSHNVSCNALTSGRIAAQLSRRGTQQRWVSMQELERTREGRERVVILGSGWAGFTLSRDLDHKKYQVVVVSPRSYFVFTPLLASTSVGTLEFRNALEPVRGRSDASRFVQGWADAVDYTKKTLSIEEAVQDPRQGFALTADPHENENPAEREKNKRVEKQKGQLFELQWDKLCVTVGCYSQTFNTPGVKEHAFFLKDVGDARSIRNRVLACFEISSLPTTSVAMKKALLHFAVVGGGPTGIEWAAELHDIITQDLVKVYPDLMQHYKITVYDVAPKVLSMFDDKLAKYATETFRRERINILTQHHVVELRKGVPKELEHDKSVRPDACFTLHIKEGGETSVGMVVWSTGLMMNPFVKKALSNTLKLPIPSVDVSHEASKQDTLWQLKKNPKNGAVMTNDRLRAVLVPEGAAEGEKGRAILNDVFALGDCATNEEAMYPATAQVANQKARWLAKRLNKQDLDRVGFTYKDLGIMAYVGNWNAIMQSSGGDISGRVAWLIWRGAYLAKSLSWRNRILISTYWFVNWVFGRDISRF